MSKISNHDLIDEWINSLEVQGKSRLTIIEYKKTLLMLIEMDFFKESNLLDISIADITQFRFYRVTTDNVSARTLNKNLSGLKSFLNYCLMRGYIEQNFFSDIRVKDKNKTLPRPIDVNTINKILDKKDPRNPKYKNQYIRDLAAAEIAYSGGLRIAELHNIKLDNMNLQTQSIKVLGKGSKERIIFLGHKAIEAISTWLIIRNNWIKKAGIADCGYLFIAPNGKHISKNHLGSCITALLKSENYGVYGSTHTLRHSFASHLYSKTKDIRAVQEMLGHNSIASTQVYVLVDHETLISSYNDAHPRAQTD